MGGGDGGRGGGRGGIEDGSFLVVLCPVHQSVPLPLSPFLPLSFSLSLCMCVWRGVSSPYLLFETESFTCLFRGQTNWSKSFWCFLHLCLPSAIGMLGYRQVSLILVLHGFWGFKLYPHTYMANTFFYLLNYFLSPKLSASSSPR